MIETSPPSSPGPSQGDETTGRRHARGARELTLCQSFVSLVGTQTTIYSQALARAAARPHVVRAARCFRGERTRLVMVTLDVGTNAEIRSATIGGEHDEAEAACLQSIFANTELPAAPQSAGPLVLTVSASGCKETTEPETPAP